MESSQIGLTDKCSVKKFWITGSALNFPNNKQPKGEARNRLPERRFMKVVIDEKEVLTILFNSALWGKRRRIKNRQDFGDEASVGVHLRREGLKDYKDHDFGIYLGEHFKCFYVGTMLILKFQPTRLEVFDTLSELKEQWEVD